MQNILFSFLNDRYLTVNVDGVNSQPVPLKAGTPQGSCLSPVLYNIFVNDLTSAIDENLTSSGQYADDVGLYSTDRSLEVAKNCVQNALDAVMEWCRKWQVMMNTKKSQVIVFTKCPLHKKDKIQLKMFNEVIPIANEITYLGVVFDSRLTWEQQIKRISERAHSRLNLLRAMASLSQRHNPTLLYRLYNSTIRSIFEYSGVCIVSAAASHLRKLQLIQNEALRIILKVPSYIPIATMNDGANQKDVRDHLREIAGHRIQRLIENSRLVQNTVATYGDIRHNNYNISPLDVVQI